MEKLKNIEAHLLEKLASDDEKSFEYLFNFYYKPLKVYATGLLLDQVLAQDIVQEVFFKLWKNRKELQIKDSLRSYLYRMTYNQCVDFLRKDKMDAYSIDTLDLNKRFEIMGIKEDDSVLSAIFSKEMLSAYNKAVEKLPNQCRKIFLKSRSENLSYKEIATELNLSLSTVKNQMVIAMNKLSEELKHYLVCLFIVFPFVF